MPQPNNTYEHHNNASIAGQQVKNVVPNLHKAVRSDTVKAISSRAFRGLSHNALTQECENITGELDTAIASAMVSGDV